MSRPVAGGYTLLEVLLVLGVVALLALMTGPGFQDAIRRNARDAAMLDLMSSIALARSEAVTQGRRVSICRSVNQTGCAGSSGGDWRDGWIVFADAGTAGTVNMGDTLLQVHSALTDQVKVTLKTSTNGNFTGDFLQFNEDSFLNNSTTGAYFKFCDQDNVQVNARAVWIANTGRATMSVEQPDGIHHDLAGANLSCP